MKNSWQFMGMQGRYLKALPAMRVMLLAMLVLALLSYFMIGFIISYQSDNRIHSNQTLVNLYGNSTSNSSAFGGNCKTCFFGKLNSLATTTSNLNKSLGNSGGVVSTLVTAVGLGFSLVPAIFNFYISIGAFLAIPFIALGFPVFPVILIWNIAILLIPVIIIISAFLLKDI